MSGGLLAARLTDLPGASKWFAGGVVAYSNESKSELLGVDPGLIEEQGAVSPEVAEAMADGALERFGADVAVAITGIAGPDGGSEEKPVGYVCFCARLADGTKIARDPVIPGGRDDIRERSVLVAMHLLRHAAGAAPKRRSRAAAAANPRFPCVVRERRFAIARCSVRREAALSLAARQEDLGEKKSAGAPCSWHPRPAG